MAQIQPTTLQRTAIAVTIGITCGAMTWVAQVLLGPAHSSDFAQVWYAASAWLHGQDPYEVVGPGRAFAWHFPLLYPITAVIVGMPFTLLSLHVAEGVFVGLGGGLLTFALTKETLRSPALLVFPSVAMVAVFQTAQWGPLLTAAALMPSLGFVLACKPSVGLALLAAYPTWRAVALAGMFMAISFAIWPWSLTTWLGLTPTGTHIVAPVTRWGGPLILLALLRWRRPEARLVSALALVPHTPELYEVIPLFLVVRCLEEGLILVALTLLVQVVRQAFLPYDSYLAWMDTSGQIIVLMLYLPCVAMILRRPNEGLAFNRPRLLNRFFHQPHSAGSIPSS